MEGVHAQHPISSALGKGHKVPWLSPEMCVTMAVAAVSGHAVGLPQAVPGAAPWWVQWPRIRE